MDRYLRNEAPDIRVRLGAEPVVNLTGTLTTLGGISARPEAIEAAAAIMAHGVDIVELQSRASQVIAEVTSTEAGFVSACTSAGICMAVAGAMTGDRMAAIERLPDTGGMKNEVVIQVGHLVNYGHPVEQDIRLTGASVVPFGAVNSVTQAQLDGAIGPHTAAALFVVSHHCAPHGQLPFTDFVRVCHARDVPEGLERGTDVTRNLSKRSSGFDTHSAKPQPADRKRALRGQRQRCS